LIQKADSEAVNVEIDVGSGNSAHAGYVISACVKDEVGGNRVDSAGDSVHGYEAALIVSRDRVAIECIVDSKISYENGGMCEKVVVI
jgi:hypothetical protein